MSYILGKDVSQWNNYAPDTEDFVMIKMSGGDAGLYFDSKASVNYTNAKNAGKVVGGYHFAGGGDPIAEATYFLKAMSPVAENDIFALDWEIQHANPVAWAQAFVNEVHSKVGVWPLIYINISTCNAYDWSPVLANCGLWLAAPSYSYNANAPVHHPYVMQQGPIVNGIDQDAFFGTREQLQAYGHHASTPPPTPVPNPPIPVEPAPTPPKDYGEENNTLLKQILALLQGLVTKFTSIFK
jgi:GH25 family lysozyme M1 (1,4-beta-N-acetylmuramidase)